MQDMLDIEGGELLERLLVALAIIVGTVVVVQVFKRLVHRYVEDPERQFKATRLIGRIGGLLALVLVLGVVFDSTAELLTVLTIVGAGLAIAMRETLMSLFGWSYIVFRTPFRAGDRIEVNGIQGDVIDIRLIHTILMEIGRWVDADQSTGRIVHVPNSAIFLHGVYNYTAAFHFIWNEMPVTVTFRSDWQAAHDIMLALANESAARAEEAVRQEIKEMAQEYLIFYQILTPFVYVRLVDNGIRLTLRYLCEARKRRGTEHALTISMLQRFKDHGGIELAYPALGITRHEGPQFGPMPGLAPSKKTDQTPR